MSRQTMHRVGWSDLALVWATAGFVPFSSVVEMGETFFYGRAVHHSSPEVRSPLRLPLGGVISVLDGRWEECRSAEASQPRIR